MGYQKFTVESLLTTRSGNYAQYTHESGSPILIPNFGFKIGDNVEMWDFDGYVPIRIDINGVTIWEEDNKRIWWKNHDPKSICRQNPYIV